MAARGTHIRRSILSIINQGAPRANTLIEKGLLPENLPSAFTSRHLSNALSNHASSYLVTPSRRGKSALYNASKRGEQRRIFAIPHPLFHRDASLFFEKNWVKISAVLAGSSGSASKPTFPIGGFRAVEITPQAELPAVRLKVLARKKYCLVTDVSRCFPSIYTHAIPWALDGKAAAKSDSDWKSRAVAGNRLDFIIRQGQDRQTTGIPVGPDTSRLISELILSRVDAEFVQKDRRKVYFVRHVDDYWIGGESYDDCLSHLRRLRVGLAEYGLDINESKTKIVALSEAFGETWPTDLKAEIDGIFSEWKRARQQDATAVFAKVIDQANSKHDDGIVKFVIRRIDRAEAWDRNWEILEPFLAHCAVQFPHAFDYVARVLAWRLRVGEGCDRKLWREVTLTVAAQAAAIGHDSELLWALWLLKELGIIIPARELDKYLRTSGPLVGAYIAHMSAHGLTRSPGLFDRLQDSVVGDEQFTGSRWPLTLELYHLGESNKLEAHRNASNDPVSAFHNAKASLIEWDRAPSVFERETDADHPDDWEPEYAIEDYASAYDDDDDDDDDLPF